MARAPEAGDQVRQSFDEAFEKGIRVANRQILGAHLGALSPDMMFTLAVKVGRLRAHYLQAVVQMAQGDAEAVPDPRQIEEIRRRRLAFEEARDAVQALREAIDRGYVDLQAGPKDRDA